MRITKIIKTLTLKEPKKIGEEITKVIKETETDVISFEHMMYEKVLIEKTIINTSDFESKVYYTYAFLITLLFNEEITGAISVPDNIKDFD